MKTQMEIIKQSMSKSNITPTELSKGNEWWINNQDKTLDLMKHPQICLTYTDYEGTIENGNRQMVLIAMTSGIIDESVKFPTTIGGIPLRIRTD
jgi:hypothetical protein